MTEKEMWEQIRDDLAYLRSRLDGHMNDEIIYQRDVQKQLTEIKENIAEKNAEYTTKIKGMITIISAFVSTVVGGILLWVSSRLNS